MLNTGGILSVGDRARKCKRSKQNLILEYLEWAETATAVSNKDTAQWWQTVLQFRREQSAYLREDVAKLIMAVTDQTEVLLSMLELQRDSLHSTVGSTPFCLDSPESRSPTSRIIAVPELMEGGQGQSATPHPKPTAKENNEKSCGTL